jgi:hypothetical protein
MKKAKAFIVLGIVLLIPLFLMEGLTALSHTALHLIEDFTVDLWVHVFIAGWILIAFGIYSFLKKK